MQNFQFTFILLIFLLGFIIYLLSSDQRIFRIFSKSIQTFVSEINKTSNNKIENIFNCSVISENRTEDNYNNKNKTIFNKNIIEETLNVYKNKTCNVDDNRIYITYVCQDDRRLGNHIFNVASLMGIARSNNFIPVLLTTNRILERIDIRIDTVSSECFNYHKMLHFKDVNSRMYDNRTSDLINHFHKSNLTTKKALIMLHGFYQSWKYFDNIPRSELMSRINFKERNKIAAQKTLSKFLQNAEDDELKSNNQSINGRISYSGYTGITKSGYTTVGIHVRRGDMLLKVYKSQGHNIPNTTFLTHAMNYFQSDLLSNDNILFVVCSDDIKWCKHNIKGKNVYFSENNAAETDLALLGFCNHTVMAFSSFSFWAAYFAGGTAVYYRAHIRPKSLLFNVTNIGDHFYPSWIGKV